MRISTPIVIADTETTSGKVEEAKVIEVAVALLDQDLKISETMETLVNPGIPIPPGASAIHHLTDADVQAAPLFEELSLDHMFNPDVVFVAHNAQYDKAMLPPWQGHRWLCTLRLARHLLTEQESHALQVLRYSLHLKPITPEGLLMHRAMADVYVTVELFRYILDRYAAHNNLAEDAVINIDDLIALSEKPILYAKMPFGKHKGEEIKNVPRSYMRWALDNMNNLDADMRYTFEHHLGGRR